MRGINIKELLFWAMFIHIVLWEFFGISAATLIDQILFAVR